MWRPTKMTRSKAKFLRYSAVNHGGW
jgi:hypothetical protein